MEMLRGPSQAAFPAQCEVAPMKVPLGYYLTVRPREAPRAVAAEAIHQVLADATPTAGAAGTLVVLQFAVTASKAPWAHTLVPVYQVLGVWTGGSVSEPQTTPPLIPSSHPP